MKKFLSRLFIYVLSVALLTVCVNFAYIKLDRSNSDNIKKMNSVPYGINICNFGSSHGAFSFNYSDVSSEITCFNFSFSGQTLTYDKEIYDEYKDHLCDDAVVFITISYFSFYGLDESVYDGFLEKNAKYYCFLPPESIKQYDLMSDICFHHLPVLGAGDNLFRVFMGQSKDTHENAWLQTAVDKNLPEHAENAYYRHFVFNRLDENGNRIFNTAEYEAAVHIAKDVKARGGTPVFITTPFTPEYTSVIEKNVPTFMEEFRTLMEKTAAETGALYIDQSHNEFFYGKPELFIDSDHLNKEGGRQFTNLLLEQWTVDS